MSQHILKKEMIATLEGTRKTHFLNQQARRLNKSLGDIAGLSQLGFHLIEVPVGCFSTEQHVHYYEEECVYILEGQAQAHFDRQIEMVYAGDFIAYPAGGPSHTLFNDGDRLLKCIVVGQRLAHDVADYPNQKKRIFRNQGLSWNLVNLESIDNPVAGSK